MHLSPRDIDKLLLHNAGFLAQKRLARGLKLNYPEAVALIARGIDERCVAMPAVALAADDDQHFE